MKLTLNLSPIRSDDKTMVSVSASVLTINGTDYDLSELPDGATANHPELGTVKRNGSVYECTIPLSHGPGAPHETRFPAPIVLENHYGPVELPVYDIVPETEQEPTL